jgi:hypothetical protein
VDDSRRDARRVRDRHLDEAEETNDGYIARVEARTRAGDLVGAAEAECSRAESTWARRDAYALRSMAQTRAIGRALRAPLGQIVVLAGYEPAGAEEMPTAEPDQRGGKIPDEIKPKGTQLRQIAYLLESLEEIDPDTDWKARARELAGASGDMLTHTSAIMLIGLLEEELQTLVDGAADDAA